MDVTRPYRFIWFGDAHVPKPYTIGPRVSPERRVELEILTAETQHAVGPRAESAPPDGKYKKLIRGRYEFLFVVWVGPWSGAFKGPPGPQILKSQAGSG